MRDEVVCVNHVSGTSPILLKLAFSYSNASKLVGARRLLVRIRDTVPNRSGPRYGVFRAVGRCDVSFEFLRNVTKQEELMNGVD